MTPSLDPISISLWPDLRNALIEAFGMHDLEKISKVRSLARSQGLFKHAFEDDLSWACEAFLFSDKKEAIFQYSLPLRAHNFSCAGVCWNQLAPLVFKEAVNIGQDCLLLAQANPEHYDNPALIRNALSAFGCALFISFVGTGDYPTHIIKELSENPYLFQSDPQFFNRLSLSFPQLEATDRDALAAMLVSLKGQNTLLTTNSSSADTTVLWHTKSKVTANDFYNLLFSEKSIGYNCYWLQFDKLEQHVLSCYEKASLHQSAPSLITPKNALEAKASLRL